MGVSCTWKLSSTAWRSARRIASRTSISSASCGRFSTRGAVGLGLLLSITVATWPNISERTKTFLTVSYKTRRNFFFFYPDSTWERSIRILFCAARTKPKSKFSDLKNQWLYKVGKIYMWKYSKWQGSFHFCTGVSVKTTYFFVITTIWNPFTVYRLCPKFGLSLNRTVIPFGNWSKWYIWNMVILSNDSCPHKLMFFDCCTLEFLLFHHSLLQELRKKEEDRLDPDHWGSSVSVSLSKEEVTVGDRLLLPFFVFWTR